MSDAYLFDKLKGKDWFLWRIAKDKDLGRPDRRERIAMSQPDIDICSSCGEHAEFEETDGGCVSNCCGAKPYDTDPDIDMER